MLPKINKADMAGTMESIKEYIRLLLCVVRMPLAFVTRKTITVQTYGDYSKYETPDNKMITRMLHLTPTRISCTMSKVHNPSRSIQRCTR